MQALSPLRKDSIHFLCALGLFIAGFIFYSSAWIQSYYTAEFNLTSWEIGIVQSIVSLGAIAGAILAGRAADLCGRRRLLLWNFLGIIVAGLLSGLSFDYHSLCCTRFLNGFLAGMLYPLCATYLCEMMPAQALPRAAATLMSFNC